jgi:hypothetical protein
MKNSLLALFLLTASSQHIFAQAEPAAAVASADQEIITLSKQKWDWMAEKNVKELNELFDDQSMFVHMSGSMNKEQELKTIESGRIQYKHAEIEETSVKIIGGTAILLSKIRLDAVVGGNEVSNPFTVTEVFVKVDQKWKLGSLTFSLRR